MQTCSQHLHVVTVWHIIYIRTTCEIATTRNHGNSGFKLHVDLVRTGTRNFGLWTANNGFLEKTFLVFNGNVVHVKEWSDFWLVVDFVEYAWLAKNNRYWAHCIQIISAPIILKKTAYGQWLPGILHSKSINQSLYYKQVRRKSIPNRHYSTKQDLGNKILKLKEINFQEDTRNYFSSPPSKIR